MRIGARGGPDCRALAVAADPALQSHPRRLRSGGRARRWSIAATSSSRPSKIVDAFERIEQASSRIVEAGAVPVTIGGDGSVTVPVTRAVAKSHKNGGAAYRLPTPTPTLRRRGEVQLRDPVHPRRRGGAGRSGVLLACRHPRHDLRQGVVPRTREPRLPGRVARRAGARRLRTAHGRVPRPGRPAGRSISASTWTCSIRPARPACARRRGAGCRRARAST